ncbi:MAG TPA: FAD-dependent oxidoreductase [Pyrinomonadaceae bacterium]|nr:FAD-dependent oxidoreductase [Pyrinomonadaceae bacterium]
MCDQHHRKGRQIAHAFNMLELGALHDVLIVGAGLIGSAIAWLLSKSGCSVVLMDAGRFGGEASSAGAGMLAPGGEYREPSPAAQFAIESLAMYPAFVRQLEKDSGVPIDYRNCGAIELAYERERWRALQARASVQRKFGIPVHLLCPSSLSAVAPGLNSEGLFGALYYDKDACVAPADLLRALRELCDRGGVKIMENSPVESIDAERDRVTVRIAKHHITGRNLVLSAGSWSSLIPLSRSGAPTSIPTSVPVKGHLAGYQLSPGSLRPILRHGHHYVVQRRNGFTVAGSSEETCGFNRSVNPERIREIRDEIGSFYTPLLTKEPTREWVGFRPGIEHHGPVISRVQGTKVWLAYGHYRNGILLTPATAHLVSGEILGYPKQIAGDWLRPVGYGRSPEQRVGIS